MKKYCYSEKKVFDAWIYFIFIPLFLLLDISIYCIKSDSITNIISKKKSFVNTLKHFQSFTGQKILLLLRRPKSKYQVNHDKKSISITQFLSKLNLCLRWSVWYLINLQINIPHFVVHFAQRLRSFWWTFMLATHRKEQNARLKVKRR